MKKLNNKKGISLIVLVITIIVMIVLAAAIILSLQSSGIIGRANEAKTKTNSEAVKEQLNISISEALLKGNNPGFIDSVDDLKSSLKSTGLDAEITGDFANGYIITIGENIYEVSTDGKVALSTKVRFKIGEASYECEKGTTWETFISTMENDSDGVWRCRLFYASNRNSGCSS